MVKTLPEVLAEMLAALSMYDASTEAMTSTEVSVVTTTPFQKTAEFVRSQKANAWADSGATMKVLHEEDDDGRIHLTMPDGCPPDSVGYNMNKCLQREKKTMAAARLRHKLAAKNEAKAQAAASHEACVQFWKDLE